jgi:PUL domain
MIILLAHCHRKINLRAIFDISTDPILFKNVGNLENIINKLQSLLDEANITLKPTEQATLQKATSFIEKPQENGDSFAPKEWDELVGE